MKKVLMLLDNPFTNDNRVKREIETLCENGFEVNLIAIKNGVSPDVETLYGAKIERLLSTELFDIKNNKYKTQIVSILENRDFDLIHCHDQEMLNIAVHIKKLRNKRKQTSFPIIYDSHELFHYWPLNVSNYNSLPILIKSFLVRKFQIRREKKNVKYVNHFITVNNSLANNLKEYFNLHQLPIVLRNIPDLETPVKNNTLRQTFKIKDTTKILVFIGANIYPKTLNLEQVITEFSNQKNIALVFIAKKNKFQKEIQNYADAKKAKNIYFHDLITPEKINQVLSSADVGLVPTWNKKDLSYWYALDNKLFEYLMAEIPTLATKQPEYINVVEKYNIGICVNPDKKNAYIQGFKSIISNDLLYKEQLINTKKMLNWNLEKTNLVTLYKSLTQND